MVHEDPGGVVDEMAPRPVESIKGQDRVHCDSAIETGNLARDLADRLSGDGGREDEAHRARRHRSLRKSSVTWGSWREIVITRSVTATTFAISRPSSFCPGTSVSSSSRTATRSGVLVGTQHAR